MSAAALHLCVLFAVFVCAAVLPWAVWQLLARQRMRQRLNHVTGARSEKLAAVEARKLIESIASAVGPLARLSSGEAGSESAIRRRLMQAGIRNPRAPILFFAIKTVLAFGLPLLLMAFRVSGLSALDAQDFFFLLALVCAAGFYAPTLVLDAMIRRRSSAILAALPDALDLLTICVEAGLTLDAAVTRVAREMEINSRELGEELQLLAVEFRSGLGKQTALRNLAQRVGLEDLDSLVAMLLQAEKFGTSMAESLRIYSGVLRHRRQSRAEEAAGKVAVKLIFPLVLCIFPAIMLVVAGPSMIRITKMLPSMVGGG